MSDQESHVATLAADALPVAIWMGRVPSGEVVYTNAAFREVLGIDPPEGAARGAFVEPYGVHTRSGEPYPESRMPFERVLALRAEVVLDDLVIHRRDGGRVYLRVFAKPIFDDDGTLAYVLEAFHDITREVEAERARAEGERRLARAQRLDSLGQLAAGIAHDFNNLLTVTKLALSCISPIGADPRQARALREMRVATDSAIQLVKNLLGFARRDKRTTRAISLDDVVRPVIDMARRTLDPAITLRADLGAHDATILGDVSEIEQLVMNLVLNARDAIRGSGEIVVRTELLTLTDEERHGGRFVVLEVADDGVGIDSAIRDRIFEPYFTTKTHGPVKGTGLGLSIVHGIVTSLGGFVDVQPNAPTGTVLRVGFPSRTHSAASSNRAGDDGTSPTSTQERAHGELILVVDDEPQVRTSTAESLRALGFQTCEAGDGASALDAFRSRSTEISAVVLDMVMPSMRGRDIFLAMRELRPDVRVLLVTGSGLNDEAQDILDLGVGAWLAKPYDDAQLASSLKRLGAY